MEQTLTSITDAQLIGAISSSRLREDQKTRLTALVGKMGESDRNELMGIVSEVNRAAEEADIKQPAIDAKYEKSLRTIVREETGVARKAFEALEQKGSQVTIQNLEAEIQESHEPSRLEGLEKQAGIARQNHHVKLKIFLALAILFSMAGGIVYVISMFK